MKFIGVDAGGSKTRVLSGRSEDLAEEPAIREEVMGPGNVRQLGADGLSRLIRDIVTRLDIADPDGVAVVAGFAGAGTPESQDEVVQAFADEGFGAHTVVTSDGGLLLWALGGRGIALIAGTGSICLGCENTSPGAAGAIVRAGGYGYRLHSEAGGYQLGIAAIDAALRMEDGRLQTPTVLYDCVKNHFGLARLNPEIIAHLYPSRELADDVRERVAALAGFVFGAAANGDEAAVALIEETVEELADLVHAVSGRLGVKTSVVGLHGGLFAGPHADELLLVPLTRHPLLEPLDLQFQTLGVREGDPDPLLA